MRFATCIRCGRECRYATGPSDARFIRAATKGNGRCLECTVIVAFQQLMNMHGVNAFPTGTLPHALALPHVQQQFGRVLKAGRSDADIADVDWGRVIALWSVDKHTTGTLF